MSPRTRNILSGLTAVVGLVGLGWMIFMFGEIPTWAEKVSPLYIDLPDAGGLARGSRVTFNGIEVGYVESVQHHSDPRRGVELLCQIDPEQRIPTHSKATVASGVLGGSASLAISMDRSVEGELTYLAPGDRLTGSSSTLATRLEAQLDEGLQRFDDVSARIAALADQYVEVGKKLNDMLAERTIAEVDTGKAQPNLRTAIARADENLAALSKTIDHLNELVGNPQLKADISVSASNARQLTEDAKKSLDQLTKRYVAAADQLSQTLTRIDALAQKAQEGDGTVSKLLNDAALYQSLQDASERAGEALKEFKLLIQKWKAEGVPVQF